MAFTTTSIFFLMADVFCFFALEPAEAEAEAAAGRFMEGMVLVLVVVVIVAS